MLSPDLGTRMQAAEAEAFEEFDRKYTTRFYWYFIRRGLSPVDSEQLAEELISEIMLSKIWSYEPRESGTFGAWARRLAENKKNDWYRKDPPQWLPLNEDLIGYEDEQAQSVLDPRELAVREALSQLDEDDCAILDYRDLRNLSFAEIGTLLEIAEGTARVRHLRAKRRLEELLRSDARIVTVHKSGE